MTMQARGDAPRILLDAHGGDRAPGVVFEAVRLLQAEKAPLEIGVVGTDEVAAEAEALGLAFVRAETFVAMDDPVVAAVRRKRGSTMHVGCKLVREGAWDAFVSAGNTGALMAIAKLVLKTVPGVERPAIATMIPARNDTKTLFLDMGANVDCTAEHLVQFALMGSCYMQAAEGLENPRVGLLNIGSEAIKGNDVVKLAASLLEDSPVNYIGFVEGGDLFSDRVDVVVADGFVGNVALKVMEGTARFLAEVLREELTGRITGKLGAWLARGALAGLKERVDPGRYNGAPLLGLNGIVVKSHGAAGAEEYARAVQVAAREARAGIVHLLGEMLGRWEEA